MSNLLIHDNENIIIYADDLIKDIDEDFFDPRAWLDDDNTNVFVISHKESLEGKFDRTLKFEKIKNFSVVNLSLAETD